MYRATGTRSRAKATLAAVASTSALALLWAFRPSLKGLPGSLAEPLTATALEDVGLWLAWLALACLSLLALVRALRSTSHSRQTFRTRGVVTSNLAVMKRSFRTSAARDRPSQPRTAGSRVFGEQVVLTVPVPVETPVAVEEDQESRLAAAAEAPRVSVSVLGPLRISGGKRRRRIRASAHEVVAYLAFHPEGATRDQLLEAVWPGEDPKRSEQRLWQSTSDVRRALGDVIAREGDRYTLDRAKVSVDLDELERVLAAARAADAERRHQLMEHALALITGEPLSGSAYAWADGEVRRLRAVHVDLLEQVGRARLAAEPRAALDAAERGLAIDGLNEGLWRLALEAESALGLREAVAERYEHLRIVLDERLGLEPAQETKLLHRRLLAQH